MPTPPITPTSGGSHDRPSTGRRRVATAVAVTVSLAVAGACGSSRAESTPTATAPAPPPSSTTTRPPVTTKVAHRHHTVIVAPLTGLPATRSVARRPAVVVKIDNLQSALPQTGPNQADVVYEEMVEGGLTRLAAVFQSDYPATVGPVRSGRLTDEGIADDLHHPVLAYAGANAIFQPQLASQPVQDVDDDTNPDLFVRNYAQEAPHNLYSNVAGLAALDASHTPPGALWTFRASGSGFGGAGVKPASSISIDFPAASVQWIWSVRDRLWLRVQNGSVDVDFHGAQLTAANVIVQFIPYTTSGYVTGEGAGADGGAIPEGQFVGSGTAWFLSGGAIVKGSWSRASLTARTVYKDPSGAPIRLQPGRTWVELPEDGTATTLVP